MKRIQRNFLFFLFFSLMLTACNEKEEDMEEKIACLTITEALPNRNLSMKMEN